MMMGLPVPHLSVRIDSEISSGEVPAFIDDDCVTNFGLAACAGAVTSRAFRKVRAG
jgi:hypothetical protein